MNVDRGGVVPTLLAYPSNSGPGLENALRVIHPINAPAESMTTFSGLYRPVNDKFQRVLDMLLDRQAHGFRRSWIAPTEPQGVLDRATPGARVPRHRT